MIVRSQMSNRRRLGHYARNFNESDITLAKTAALGHIDEDWALVKYTELSDIYNIRSEHAKIREVKIHKEKHEKPGNEISDGTRKQNAILKTMEHELLNGKIVKPEYIMNGVLNPDKIMKICGTKIGQYKAIKRNKFEEDENEDENDEKEDGE